MCGIVGFVGQKNTVQILMEGLKRLEYRGYDSAGIAVLQASGVEPPTLEVRKRSGKLNELSNLLEESPITTAEGAITAGIGHTRWATHGAPTDTNSHPHLGDHGDLALIHNGIIENYPELRDEVVAAGIELDSETDTAIVAELLGLAVTRTGSLEAAFRETLPRLRGTYTLLAVHKDEPGRIVAAKHHSPLLVGFGDGEAFLGSDIAAFGDRATEAAAIHDDRIVVVEASGVTVTDLAGNHVEVERFVVDWDPRLADKGGWDSFMAKEISEQPDTIRHTIAGRIEHRAQGSIVRIPELTQFGDDVLTGVDRIILIGCGTAAYAGQVAKYLFERWAGVPCEVQLSHEFRYADQVITPNTLVISVSQSGETMDTLMAVKHAVDLGARTISVCNTQAASIPRASDATVYTHAGPEVAVASTKAFTGQVAALALIALHISALKGVTHVSHDAVTALEALVPLVEGAVHTHEVVEKLVRDLTRETGGVESVLFLGRHLNYPVAMEAALKLKEIAYIHAEGFAAGELKHGPIALIDDGQLVVVIMPHRHLDETMHAKVLSNIQEVRARGAKVIAVAGSEDELVAEHATHVIRVPETTAPGSEHWTPLTRIIPLQWLALEIATARGTDVDQPRNLAKSVTVE